MLKRVVTCVVACLLSLVLAAPAFAAPAQAALADVLKSLKVSVRPSDYVILVDTSGSMTADGRYDQVKGALASMLKALQPTDRVALITFDSAAVVRFDGLVGSNSQAPLANLPAAPTGQLTDIGKGIEAGLKVLEAGNALPVGAIALITDGKVDAPGSPYADPKSAAWTQLKSRAAALGGKHEIAAYALSLVSATDAALLKQVFPSATDIPAAQVSTRLSTLQNELLKSQAIERLKPDLAKGVTATIGGVDWADLPAAGGDLAGTLTLTSGYAQLPATVEGLKVEASGLPLTFTVTPPASTELKPGASASVPVVVHVPAGLAAGNGTVRVTGTVTSAWSDALTKSLGLTFAPKLDAAIDTHSAGAPAPSPAAPAAPLPWPLLAAAAAFVLLLALLLIARARGPRMVGSLAVSRDGRLVREFLVAGRSVKLDDSATPDLGGTVTAVKGSGPTVEVHARTANKQRTKQRLGDRQTLEVGPYRITYTAQRTRTMSMVRQGLDEPES